MIDKEFLQELHSILTWARQTESCADNMLGDDIDKLIMRINQELSYHEQEEGRSFERDMCNKYPIINEEP